MLQVRRRYLPSRCAQHDPEGAARAVKYALILMLLASCTRVETDGPDAQGYRWQKDGPTGTPVIHRDVDVALYCGLEEKALSCAVQRGDGICNIYLPEKPQPWQEAHELRHCAGWRHPDWTRLS